MPRLASVAALSGLALVCTACGQPGLESIADPQLLDPEPGVLRIDPSVQYDFGATSPEAARLRGDIRVWVEGDGPVRIVDGFLDETTSLAFTLAEAIQFPLLLEPGDEAHIGVYFEPYAVGDYFGDAVFVTLDEDEEFELSVELVGEGCQDTDLDAVCD